MNDAGVVIFILVAAGVAILVSTIAYRNYVETRNRFKQLARRFHGVLDDPGIFGSPTVRFDLEGVPVRVRQTASDSKNERRFIEFRASWADSSLRLTIRPERTLDYVGKFLGVQDIEIGAPEFDARYVIGGNNQQRICSFLTPGLRKCINDLYHFLDVDHIFLSIQGGYLEVKKLGGPRDYLLMERFVILCIELLEQAKVAGMKGIEFVAPAVDKQQTEVVCQVCGDSIRRSEVVYCRSCRTPHHEDCWNYFGACSTFGCGQRVFKQPRLKGKTSEG
jgi:hypothetical protein